MIFLKIIGMTKKLKVRKTFRLYIKENSEDVLRPDYENIERINRRGEACKPFLLRSIG